MEKFLFQKKGKEKRKGEKQENSNQTRFLLMEKFVMERKEKKCGEKMKDESII